VACFVITEMAEMGLAMFYHHRDLATAGKKTAQIQSRTGTTPRK
jgi:hypothetical protein